MPLPIAILAGGLASRLRPLTENIPKALIDIGGQPFMAHQLRLLKSRGLKRVIVCAGFLGEKIQAVIGNGRQFDLDVTYSFDGETLLGTGGSLKKALPMLGPSFFVLYGDSYLPCDYAGAAQAFRQYGKQALMTVFRNRGAWDRSNVEFSQGELRVYDKKNWNPRMEYIDYGLGIFKAEALERIPQSGPCDLAEVYRALLAEGQLAGWEVQQRFYEIGSWQGLEETRAYLLQRSA
jgi:NDP-sugar pyrophosphorylase family protein